jgi:hypothetical protein
MQDAPEPNVDRLISGGRARQRHRNMIRAWIVAAVAVVVAGGVYGLAQVDTGATSGPAPAVTPSSSPSSTVSSEGSVRVYKDEGAEVLPGRYRMVVGLDTHDVPIDAEFTLHEVWLSGNYPVLRDAGIYGGLAVYQPTALSAGTGCLNDNPNTHVAQTPTKLAQQLAGLPRSTVLQPPTPVTAFGHPAMHLQLRIMQRCGRGVYRVAETLRGGHGISYGDTLTPVVIDFWVEDVSTGRPRVDDIGGAPIVVETWHQAGASSQMVNEIAQAGDSIKIVTGG